MKLGFAILVVAACSSSAKPPDPSCGAQVTFVRAEGDHAVLKFENVSNETITIAGSSEAAFVDVDGNAMSAERPGGPWFMSFKLPAGSHREVTVTLTGDGDPARLDRVEVAHSGPGEIPLCTIKASGLAKGRTLPEKRDVAGEAMAKMREFKDAMCKCADKACADKVTDQMTKWSQQMAQHASRHTRVSEADTKVMQEITEEFTRCATKAMTAGMGGASDKLPF